MQTRQLEEAIRAYFAACDATRERLPLKNGGFSERQIPYTLYGLAAATGMKPKELLEKADGSGRTANLLKRAVCRVGAYLEERALLGELVHQVALTALAELGGEPVQSAPGGLLITMDEEAQRYAE